MLGELIEESKGKRNYRKVVSTTGGFKVEVAFEATGKLLGKDVTEIVTYSSESRPDGTLYGEGQAVIISPDGDMATWKGSGAGKFIGGGSVAYRGAIYYSTTSANWSRLNGMAGVFEFEADAAGNTSGKVWEWK